jgi:Asp-tRNA(Asn)/Glu-tRNA(Gln) amidotransferase A subunit family amidase
LDMMSMTAVELGKKIKAGEISVMEATKACIENIKTYDKICLSCSQKSCFDLFPWSKKVA